MSNSYINYVSIMPETIHKMKSEYNSKVEAENSTKMMADYPPSCVFIPNRHSNKKTPAPISENMIMSETISENKKTSATISENIRMPETIVKEYKNAYACQATSHFSTLSIVIIVILSILLLAMSSVLIYKHVYKNKSQLQYL